MQHKLKGFAATVFTDTLATILYCSFFSYYDIRVRGLQNYTASPSTLIAINHKRDLDTLIVAPILHLHKTLFKDNLRPYFLAREDIFNPGYISSHFQIPGLAGELIRKINITGIMHALRAYPISQLEQKRLESLLHEVLDIEGDRKLKEVIKQDRLKELGIFQNNPEGFEPGELFITAVLRRYYRSLHVKFTNPGILQKELSLKMRKYLVYKIEKQLEVFAQILDKGGNCLIAPEGQLSPDGRFGLVRAGIFRLISMTSRDARVLPVNITYDFMTLRRMKIYISIGPELTGLRTKERITAEQRVQKEILILGPVTLGHLGSEFLLNIKNGGRSRFEEEELCESVYKRVETLRPKGFDLEERIADKRLIRSRCNDFLDYCLKMGILKRGNKSSYNISSNGRKYKISAEFEMDPVKYSANELSSLMDVKNMV